MPVPKKLTQDLVDEITAMLAAGEEVNIRDVGKLVPVHKPAGEARNPSTGAMVSVAAKNVVKFKASSVLNKAING